MNNRFKIILIFSLALWLSGCGYSKLNNLEDNKIHLSEITFSGEQRIGYIIKNKLVLGSSPTGENNLKLNLIIDKKKEIKEKNISNKVKKYKIRLTVELLIVEVSSNKKIEKNFYKETDFIAYDNKSRTMSDERRSIQNIADQISDDIKNFINLNYKTK
jgi:hypothetical protein|tara:strand:+ start:431 stop:907 length:477 start_codon:yes stop_codon:yes gene_type:complete